MKKSDLVPVADELNDVLGLEPPIDGKKLSLSDLKKKIVKASTLIEPGDTFSEDTMKVFQELEISIGDPDDEETIVLDEDGLEDEDEGVVEEAPKKKPAASAASLPKHEGSMAQFMDGVLVAGGSWEYITSEVQAEADFRGIDPKKYTTGVIRAHAKFRVSKGTLALAIDAAGVTPTGEAPKPKKKTKK